jgi:2-polyprenyl-3-methyl-5-hydroxy-6-metoxy-1,4-benzoquinol methylase
MNSFVGYWNQMASVGKSRFEQVGMPDANETTIRSIVDEMLYYIPPLSFDSSILEVGCGNGLLLEELQRRGYSRLTGTDYSTEMIAKANEYCSGIDFRVMDSSALNQELGHGRFDLIYLHSVTQYFESEDYFNRFLDACLALLSKGGCLYIGDVFNVYVYDYIAQSAQNSSLAKVKRLLRRGRHEYAKSNFYLDLANLDQRHLAARGYRVYPLLEWVNTKPLMFKALRYNLLIKPINTI